MIELVMLSALIGITFWSLLINLAQQKKKEKFIVCNGRSWYHNQSSPYSYKDEPTQEFTLNTDHINRFGRINDDKFHTWLICIEMPEGNIRELWLEETPEQIRSAIRSE